MASAGDAYLSMDADAAAAGAGGSGAASDSCSDVEEDLRGIGSEEEEEEEEDERYAGAGSEEQQDDDYYEARQLAVEEFPLDEQETADTTARQHTEEGRDLQGIPWDRLQVSRADYRQQRLARYRNYMNCIPEDDCAAVRAQLVAGWRQPAGLAGPAAPFAFVRNWRSVASSIVHFQLRNLLAASSAHDVCVVYDNRVQHFSTATRRGADVLDLRGLPRGPRLPGLGRVQVSTMCVRDSLLAAGGFCGELVLADMRQEEQGAAWEDEQQQLLQQEQEQQEQAAQHSWVRQQQQQQEQEQRVQQAYHAASQLYAGAQLGSWQLSHTWQQQQQQHPWQQQAQQQQQQQQQPGPLQPPAQQQGAAWPQQLPNQQQHHGQPQRHQHQQQRAGWQQPAWPGPHLPAQQQQPKHPQQQDGRRQQRQGIAAGGAGGGEDEVLRGAAGPAAARVLHCCRVTQSENGITNGLEIFDSPSLGCCVMASNNDCCVRLFDVEGCRPRQRLAFPFAVNYASLRPAGAAPGGGAVVAVVGDDPATHLVDCRTGLEVMTLAGHKDFSFAAAWHPAGHLLATGNQDSTTRVWDVRAPYGPLAVLGGTMGAIRSLRFSPDGAHLAAAEPADFVHVYDVASGFAGVQEVDLFGEVAGVAFSPDSQKLFLAMSDTLYGSLVAYQRASPALLNAA